MVAPLTVLRTVFAIQLLAFAPAPPPPTPPIEPKLNGLLAVKRVFVDQMTGGGPAAQMRELIIASMQTSGLFVVTENEENADAYLRGAADEDVYMENHVLDESISARANTSRGRAVSNARSAAARDTDSNGLTLSERESSRIQERRHDVLVTVRLVLKNGDVVWSTTQESGGAKFKGASADAAAKVARQLSLDYERARRTVSAR